MSWWTDLYERVRLVALERLDLVDVRGLQSTVQEYTAEALGALMGPASGCISAPVMTYSSSSGTHYMDVGAFQFYYSFPVRRSDGSLVKDGGTAVEPEGSTYGDGFQKAWQGLVITHDPEDAGQSTLSRLDITSLLTLAHEEYFSHDPHAIPGPGESGWQADLHPNLWARPTTLDTETDARRQWDVDAAAELPVTLDTRTRMRVEFKLQLAEPPVDVDEQGAPIAPPWVKVGRVLRYDDGEGFVIDGDVGPAAPRVYPVSVWDDDEMFAFTQEPGTSNYSSSSQNVDAVGDDTGQEAQYGLPPVQGHTPGISAFLSPFPDYEDDERFEYGGFIGHRNLVGPQGLGLVGALHLVRNRIKVHLDTSGEGSDGFYSDRSPWYKLPRYGLEHMADLIDDLSSTHTSDVADLEGRIEEVEASTSVETRPHVVGAVTYQIRQQGSSGDPIIVANTIGEGEDVSVQVGADNSQLEVIIDTTDGQPDMIAHMVEVAPVANQPDYGAGQTIADAKVGSYQNGYGGEGGFEWRARVERFSTDGSDKRIKKVYVDGWAPVSGTYERVAGSFVATFYRDPAED